MTIRVPKLVTPGDRLKYIRENLLKLSRAEIHRRYQLSPDTLAAWENGKIQISEKGIDRCIKIYSEEHLIVAKEWLLSGEGLSPNFSFNLNQYFKTLPTDKPTEKIEDSLLLAREIEFFRSLSPNSITGLVSSDNMLPIYSKGDYVGGRFRYDKDIASCVGKDCIVNVKSGATYIRRLVKNANDHNYYLICLNPACHDTREPVIFNVEIECAAPIIWCRRPDLSNP